MDLAQKLERLLLDLGDSPEAVAAFLEGQGVKGWRRMGGHCPVSRFLQRQGWLPPIHVTAMTVCRRHSIYSNQPADTLAVLPDPVQRFVDRFDGGEWPALEARG